MMNSETSYTMKLRQAGITLIELMTVLIIVSILASIAIPSYSQYVKRSHRAEAKSALLQNAQFLERNFTVTNNYSNDGGGDALTSGSLPVQRTPKDGGEIKYTITLENDGTSFELKAVPEGVMNDDECGTMSITNTGLKDSTKGDSAKCWSK